jgi:hypothetical protein
MRPVLTRLLALATITLVPVSDAIRVSAAELPVDVTVGVLLANPESYHHKLIRVTGVVSHGFEDFTLKDPTGGTDDAVWLEYGGWVASDTIYCCGAIAGASRREVLAIDDIRIPLKKDKQFRRFDRLLKRTSSSVVRATIVGRFFERKRSASPDGKTWSGYGHFGFYSLLAIQQIVSVDSYTIGSKTSPN